MMAAGGERNGEVKGGRKRKTCGEKRRLRTSPDMSMAFIVTDKHAGTRD